MRPRAVRLVVRGRVQGVGYRSFVVRAAQSSGVRGSVRNLAGGEVDVYAEGAEEAIERFIATLAVGPRLAHVERIETKDVEPVGCCGGFEIRY